MMEIRLSSPATNAIARWEYRDIAGPPVARPKATEPKPTIHTPPAPGLTETEVLSRVEAAILDTERRCVADAELRETQREAQISFALKEFETERASYFRQLETEVVGLALAVARKILQREAELDPALLGALVRIALDRLEVSSAVRVRVSSAESEKWRHRDALNEIKTSYELVPDEGLQAGECVLETELGTAHVGVEAQLKEVEQGLFDLLARRPGYA